MTARAGAGDLVVLAERAARAAGDLLRTRTDATSMPPGADVGVVDTKSSPTDVVTAMDRAAERLLRAALLTARPNDGFLGEESSEEAGSSGVRWVVDPIDGTVNYLYGIPQYAVSVGAEVDGEVVAGVVHNPASGETWTAVRGQGARLDGNPVRASDVTDLRLALVATGFGYVAARRAAQAHVAAALLPLVRDIRRMGAASLDLCAVAAGRVDAYYEQGLAAWDLAAGGLIAREAGARVEGAHGLPAGAALVIAAPVALFDAIHDRVSALADQS